MRITFTIAVTLCAIVVAQAILLGVVPNASLIAVPSNITISQSTCHDCECAMLTLMNNLTILSFNCFTLIPTGVICQFFTSVTYLIPQSYQMVPNVSSTYYFLHLPPVNQIPTTMVLPAMTSAARGEDEPLLGEEKWTWFVCRIISFRWYRINYLSSNDDA